MKNTLALTALFFTLPFFAQRNIAGEIQRLQSRKTHFVPVAPLAVNPQPDTRAMQKAVKNAGYAVINPQVLHSIVSHGYPAIALAIPYNGTTVTVQLYKTEIEAEGFHIDTDKQKNIPYKKGVHYRGIVAGDYASVAAFSFFNEGMGGIVSSAELSNLVVGRQQKAGNTTDYIIYRDTDLTLQNDFKCVTEGGITGVPEQQTGRRDTNGTQSQRCVTMYFELDYDLFAANNYSTDAAAAWLATVFNNVQALFENDGITTAIKSVFIWTEPDPYLGAGSSDYLLQFYQMRPVFDGDLGQLLGIDNGGFGGVAIDIAALCSEYRVSYGDINYEFLEVPLFSWTVEVITHEFGHLLGSPHTHGCYWNGNNTQIDACGAVAGYEENNCSGGPLPSPEVQGTIMSYCHLLPDVGISFANGFGPQPAQRMLNHIESSACLSTDCINTCINTVRDFNVINNTPSSATISWTDDSGGPWEIGYNVLDNFITNWQTVTESSFTVNGLAPGEYYTFAVRPVCVAGLESGLQRVTFAGGADWCAGAAFTDTGGAFGNYNDNERLIRTLMPEVPSESFTVTFSQFSLEDDYDFMYVYDGPGTNYPLIGAYTGSQVPGPFTATSETGALTFEFISDTNITFPGWEATASCLLGTAQNTLVNLQYYPNPATHTVHITAGEPITHLWVYNVSGQLLLNKAVNSATVDADIAPFASGVYFFKVEGGTKTAHFRIIKQ